MNNTFNFSRTWNHTNLLEKLHNDLDNIININTNDRFFNINTTLIHELATKFTIFLKNSMLKYGGFDDNIIHTCFNIYENTIEKLYPDNHNITPSIIYNTKIYSWYYNNCLYFLLMLAINPESYLIDTTDECATLLYKPTRKNIHQLYIKCYDLITKKDVDHDSIDWSNKTLYQFLQNYEEFFVTNRENNTGYINEYNNYIKSYFKLFKQLCKYGKNINNILGNIFLKKYKKRKNAGLKIENWWFELIHNPDSKIGKKVLEKRGTIFLQRFLTIKKI